MKLNWNFLGDEESETKNLPLGRNKGLLESISLTLVEEDWACKTKPNQTSQKAIFPPNIIKDR